MVTFGETSAKKPQFGGYIAVIGRDPGITPGDALTRGIGGCHTETAPSSTGTGLVVRARVW